MKFLLIVKPRQIPGMTSAIAQAALERAKSCIFTITVTYSKGIKRRGEADNS